MSLDSAADAAVDEAILDVEQQLSVLFNRSRAVWKEAAEHVHPELQPAGYKLFGTIVRLGETNAQVLSQMFDMDKSAVSRQVRTLEEFGLVESRADERDGRARVLVPTALGLERARDVREANKSRLRVALKGHSPEDLRVFADILAAISAA
ncbi:MarR family winged helix-turn-helix transcriptional regulator [Microbacterium sp. BWT-B31]|uniref:MarR family winged helix-turn-helix transcriptional regulator n=1 Tax=Microbacterium sp. BWT-B31 TaxID=3232072 RepID=UPI0035295EB8